MLRRALVMAIVGLAILATGCAPKQEATAPEPEAVPEVDIVEEVAPVTAVTVLAPRADMEVSGTVTFTETDDGVEVVADIARVSPGPHGIHLHELGDCSAEDFTSTGGHFNPTDAPHGAPTDEVRHAGDFGNIEIGDDGTGQLKLFTDMLTVSEGPNSVVGRAVILHEEADDLVSQPTGAAGGRIACGIVMLEGMEMEEVIAVEEVDED